jgi:hypothetical protein
MSTTLQVHPGESRSIENRRFGLATLFAIATLMLALGFVLGNVNWPASQQGRTATGAKATVAAPPGTRLYDDWRGNSAGIGSNPRQADTIAPAGDN